MTRGQLIDDAFYLAHTGIIDYDIPNDLIKYLDDTDEEGFIISIATYHLEYIEAMSSQEISVNNNTYSVPTISKINGIWRLNKYID